MVIWLFSFKFYFKCSFNQEENLYDAENYICKKQLQN